MANVYVHERAHWQCNMLGHYQCVYETILWQCVCFGRLSMKCVNHFPRESKSSVWDLGSMHVKKPRRYLCGCTR